MTYTPFKSGTLLVPSGNKHHLFVIVTDRCAKGQHLLVNFSTIYPDTYYDKTCLIEAGQHAFIKHPSYVFYAQARVESAERLTKLVEGWYFRPSDPVNNDLLDRIIEGFSQSSHVAKWVRNYLAGA